MNILIQTKKFVNALYEISVHFGNEFNISLTI